MRRSADILSDGRAHFSFAAACVSRRTNGSSQVPFDCRLPAADREPFVVRFGASCARADSENKSPREPAGRRSSLSIWWAAFCTRARIVLPLPLPAGDDIALPARTMQPPRTKQPPPPQVNQTSDHLSGRSYLICVAFGFGCGAAAAAAASSNKGDNLATASQPDRHKDRGTTIGLAERKANAKR